jgi:glutathionylspermidine synthase
VKCVQEHPSLLCPVLGIDRKLEHLVAQSLTESLVFVGRMDWAYDTSGSLKLLEFNAETPAGLMESTALAGLIAERLGRENPNRDLVRRIRDAFDTILRDFSRGQTVKNVGLVSGAYYEDWYNTLAVYEAVRDLPYSFILGEVSGLEARGGRLYLYGTPLDAVYRYYPLDWFSRDEYYEGVIEALGSGTPSINPPSTFICQSKAFFALLWELGFRGFFDGEDLQLIRKYIPFTSLSQESFPRGDYCIKPLFGREGERVRFSIEGGDAPEEEAVFQERIDLQSVPITVRTSYSEERRAAYPIIGVYIAGKDLAGIFTRAGTRITDKWALFIPTFIGTS